MKLRIVLKIVFMFLAIVGFAMLTSVPVAYLMNDSQDSINKLIFSSLFTLIFGSIATLSIKTTEKVSFKESFAIVSLSWIVASIFAAIPFMLIADLSFVDAFFETMSGFTTTGASILNNIEELPYGLLYWRSMTHWLGGMGIVVLSLAILPALGIGSSQLFNAEVPGPVSDQLTPRVANSAKILWGVYVLLTGLETIMLKLAGMNFFDAVCHSFATLATGGFSTKQASLYAFHTPQYPAGGLYIDIIITVFMFLAGCNFVLHLRALMGKPLNFFKDEEFRFYSGVTLLAILVITASLLHQGIYSSLATAMRHSAFTVVSIITTTGFCTENFDIWPQAARVLLLFLMFFGGCGGSTGGGMKNSRILFLLKYGISQIKRCFYPHLITNIYYNNEKINNKIIHKVLSFFFLYIALFVGITILLTLIDPGVSGFDTAISASAATLGNIGPGLSKVGAWENYSWFAPQTKLLLSFAMLAGRLEIYTVLVLFIPAFWRK